ncbi:hypothetical protein [Novacetimonas hansenii]|uniref:hypothetical protein n=1 Tax=Novacetimonas hansenii TaxID=436 RepID=UPI00094F9517|nr:hypothetical protein [Novacetimonas hansenii]
MAAPPSQKYRQISFLLTGGSGADVQFTFALRPEELSVTDPTRMTTNQTLGGAWADVFGRGIRTITLTGNNGWRGGLLQSGEDMFLSLRQAVYDGWHQRRRLLLAAGQDPSAVELIFTDNLDGIHDVVVPRTFSLHRSRSRPLLMQYSIQLDVLRDATTALSLSDEITDALSNPLRWLLAQTGLGNVVTMLGQFQDYLTQGLNMLGAARGVLAQLVDTAIQLFQGVADIAGETEGIFTGQNSLLLEFSTQYALAATSGLEALGADSTLPMDDRIALMQAASTFADGACTMANGFNVNQTIPLITPLFGASMCSSTGGGDAASQFMLNNTSPFESMLDPGTSILTVSSGAQAAISGLRLDPLLLIGHSDDVISNFDAMGNGVQVAA